MAGEGPGLEPPLHLLIAGSLSLSSSSSTRRSGRASNRTMLQRIDIALPPVARPQALAMEQGQGQGQEDGQVQQQGGQRQPHPHPPLATADSPLLALLPPPPTLPTTAGMGERLGLAMAQAGTEATTPQPMATRTMKVWEGAAWGLPLPLQQAAAGSPCSSPRSGLAVQAQGALELAVQATGRDLLALGLAAVEAMEGAMAAVVSTTAAWRVMVLAV